jgi:hypothetical protein
VSAGERIVVVGVRSGETLELFRIVTKLERDATLAKSLTSSCALARPPRGWEQRSALIHMGLSMFEQPGQAAATARRFPIIGGFVARVHLTAEHGFGTADTGPPGHRTVWGRPLQLMEAVVDISSVDEHA